MVVQTEFQGVLTEPAIPQGVISLCKQIDCSGGKGWLVGGCVRDMLLGHTPKDFDLEVYGMPAKSLHNLLNSLGRTESVGKKFGILKFWSDGIEIDVALPRTEQKTGSGHCGFSVHTDPLLSPAEASLRRDFTINAMMYDPLSDTLLDYHQGQSDLKKGILRHVSSAFAEDPLRPLRAVQFAARFKLKLNRETANLCRMLLSEASQLPSSRIWEEWRKWALSDFPSFGLAVLQESGWLACYPELQAMIGCEQESHWHPEGDVWKHTLQVVDQAALLSNRYQLDEQTRLVLLLSSLCHDVGKPETSFINDKGRICSPGHAEAGVAISESFLKRISAPSRLVELILPLVREHITHLHGKPTARAIRRLSERLSPANILLWEMLVEADASGRSPAPPSRPAREWLKLAQTMQQQHGKPKPILTGKMLLDEGLESGPDMGEILDMAYQAQLDGEIVDQISAINWYRTFGSTTNNQG